MRIQVSSFWQFLSKIIFSFIWFYQFFSLIIFKPVLTPKILLCLCLKYLKNFLLLNVYFCLKVLFSFAQKFMPTISNFRSSHCRRSNLLINLHMYSMNFLDFVVVFRWSYNIWRTCASLWEQWWEACIKDFSRICIFEKLIFHLLLFNETMIPFQKLTDHSFDIQIKLLCNLAYCESLSFITSIAKTKDLILLRMCSSNMCS